MNSQHADTAAVTVRTGPEVKEAATRVLDRRKLQMRAFIVACLTALAADPDKFLATLAPHWPAPKPRGRPRRAERQPRGASRPS